jgi:hypothetical protein
MKRCPRCATPLVRKTLSAVEVDGCPDCGGVWLDAGELESLAVAGADALQRVDAAFPPIFEGPDAGDRSCPICSGPLEPGSRDAPLAAAALDCAAGHGTWFPHGALAQTAAAVPVGVENGQETAVPGDGAVAGSGPQTAAGAQAGGSAEAGGGAGPGEAAAASGPAAGLSAPDLAAEQSAAPSFGRSWRFVLAAYKLAGSRPRLLLPILVGGLAVIGMSVPFAVVTFDVIRHAGQGGLELALLPIFFWVMGLYLVTRLAAATTIGLVAAHFQGQRPRVGAACGRALGKLFAIAWIGLIHAVATVVHIGTASSTAGEDSAAGRTASAATLLTGEMWAVYSFLILPILILEDLGFNQARQRARRLYRSKLLPVAVGEFTFRSVKYLPHLVAQGALGLVLWSLVPLDKAEIVYLCAASLALLAVAGLVNAFARWTYYSLLYLWAVDRERAMAGGPPAHMPQLLRKLFDPAG